MKTNLVTVFLIVLFLIGTVPLQSGATWNEDVKPGDVKLGEFDTLFTIPANRSFRVFIEHGWKRNGQTPVILDFDCLRSKLQVDFDDWDGGDIENRVNRLLFDDHYVSFSIYEQNRLRTRMRTAENSRGVLKFKINSNRQAEFHFSGIRLKLAPIHVLFKESPRAPGELYRLIFIGPAVSTNLQFLYVSSTGTIYTAPAYEKRFEELTPEEHAEWTTWAVKDAREQDIPGMVGKENVQ